MSLFFIFRNFRTGWMVVVKEHGAINWNAAPWRVSLFLLLFIVFSIFSVFNVDFLYSRDYQKWISYLSSFLLIWLLLLTMLVERWVKCNPWMHILIREELLRFLFHRTLETSLVVSWRLNLLNKIKVFQSMKNIT